MGESQGEREPHLREREEISSRAWGRKSGVLSEERRVPSRRGRASKENLPMRSRRKHERLSKQKSFSGEGDYVKK